ncbi:MAG: hypothetical protein MUF84_17105, partial [Anaerolineae bacterium]|nr:hypothetical protein [Anaerolineae bacterium]
MTDLSDTLGSVREDPLYLQGSNALQKGNWEEATEAFEALQTMYPDSVMARRALETTRLRASLDEGRRIRGKRTTLRVGPIFLRIVLVGLIGFLVYTGGRLVIERVTPLIAAAQATQRLEQLLADGEALLKAGTYDAAEERLNGVLAIEPDNARAKAGLDVIAQERQIVALYEQAVALDAAGEDDAAMETYTELAALRPGYRDIARRMAEIERVRSVDQRFADAGAAYASGDKLAAVAAYEALRAENVAYEKALVESRLYTLYMALGREITEAVPPELEPLPSALNYFSKALALQPRSQEAGLERQLLKLYLEGQTAYYAEQWNEATAALRVVYDTRSNYLSGTVLRLLYESYVRSGDQYRDAGDSYLAYEQYLKASELPIADKAFVEGRLFYVRPFLTPTATPTATPTPRPQVAAGPPATPRPLTSYTNKIVFIADSPNRGTLYMMNPDGSGRQRLGRTAELLAQFDELKDMDRYSPEGDRFAFSQAPTPNDPWQQIFVSIPVHLRTSGGFATQVTQFGADCTDPSWSPDGNWLAFVSSELDSDDIWIIQVDRSFPQNLTPNTWEWDRHPSWSPNSDKIVFWSNRSGLLQIYTM